MDYDRVKAAVDDVYVELVRATELNGPFNSAHEGYAVILEELDELKAHVWTKAAKRNNEAMQEEAIQVAAMALRFVIDVCDSVEEVRKGMKQSEYRTLSAYWACVHSIKSQIEQVEKLIVAIETRATNSGNLSLYVSLKEKGYRDQGTHVDLPVYLAKDAVLPPLYKALRELRADFKALPPAKCEEKKL